MPQSPKKSLKFISCDILLHLTVNSYLIGIDWLHGVPVCAIFTTILK